MKDRLITLVSLSIAVAALGHSIWLQRNAASLADDALRRREAAIVRAATPKIALICQDMLGESFQPASFHPTTIEELALPLIKIINMTSDETNKPQAKTKLGSHQ